MLDLDSDFWIRVEFRYGYIRSISEPKLIPNFDHFDGFIYSFNIDKIINGVISFTEILCIGFRDIGRSIVQILRKTFL